MSAVYSVFTSPNHPPVPNHLPTLIVTPVNNPQHVLYSYIHTSFNRETYLLTPSPQGDLCVAKMVPPPGSRGPGGPGSGRSDSSHSSDMAGRDKTVRCEASRNLKWSITNTGIAAPVYKLTLPNPDVPGNEQPLFQISKPNPHSNFWTMFYFTYAGHGIPPKRIEFGKIQKNATASNGGGGGTRVAITGKTTEEKAVWQTLGDGNEDMVEWIVLCAALNLLDEEIIKAAEAANGGSGSLRRKDAHAVPSSRPGASGSQLGHGVPPLQIRQTKGNAPAPFGRPQARPPLKALVPPSAAASARSTPSPRPSQSPASPSQIQRQPSPYQQRPQQYAPMPQANGYGSGLSVQTHAQYGSQVRPPPSPVGYRQTPSPSGYRQMPQPQQYGGGQQGMHMPMPARPMPQGAHPGARPNGSYYNQPQGAAPVARHF